MSKYNSYTEPIVLLRKELIKWEKALQKSISAFNKGLINQKTYETYVKNIDPKIREFKLAIRVLDSYL